MGFTYILSVINSDFLFFWYAFFTLINITVGDYSLNLDLNFKAVYVVYNKHVFYILASHLIHIF